MWPESSSVNAVNLVKKILYNSRDIEFFLRDYFFWCALYTEVVLGLSHDRSIPYTVRAAVACCTSETLVVRNQ